MKSPNSFSDSDRNNQLMNEEFSSKLSEFDFYSCTEIEGKFFVIFRSGKQSGIRN